MHKFRSYLVIIVMTIVAACGASSAFAQDGPTNLPPFNPSMHVYVTDSWKALITSQVETAVVSAQRAQNLQAYVVYTDRGSEALNGSEPFIVTKTTQLYQAWNNAGGFPRGNFLLILVIRDSSNPTGFVVGTRIADGPGRYINKDQRGQITRNNLGLLADNPGQFPVAVITDISNVIRASAIASQGTQPTSPVARQPLNTTVRHPDFSLSAQQMVLIASISLGLVVFGIVIFRIAQYKKLSTKLGEIEGRDNPVLDNATEGTSRLEKSYLGMLTHKYNFTAGSSSAIDYERAMKAWTKFTVRLAALGDVRIKADALKKKAIPVLRHGPLSKAIAMRTTGSISIEGDVIENKDLDLMKGFVQTETLSVSNAIQALNDDFKTANTLVAGIYEAIAGAASNSAEIDAAVTAVAALRSEVAAAGVDTVEIDKEVVEIKTKTDAMKLALQKDPKTAIADSRAIKEEVLGLKTLLADVLILQKEGVATIDASIAAAEASVAGERQSFALTEENGNPDKLIAEAKAQSATLKEKLINGQLNEAEAAKTATISAVESVKTMIDLVHAGKKNVETTLAAVKAAAVETDKPAVAQIETDFATQKYLAASTALEALKALQADRSDARARSGVCVQLIAALRTLIAANANVVTAATDKLFGEAARAVTSLEVASAQPTGDWKALSAVAVETEANLQALEKSIGEQAVAYKEADAAVSQLAQDITSAGNLIADNRVSQDPRTQLAAINTSYSDLERAVRGVKQDWAAIKEKAQTVSSQLEAATRAAQSDIEAANRLEAEMQANAMRINGYVGTSYSRTIRGRTYGGVGYDSAPALAHQMAAERYYRERDYIRMEQELLLARQVADQNNMLCWWIMMESMNSSNDRYAQQWAYSQGYRDGQFDDWSNRQMDSASSAVITGDSDSWAPPADTDNWSPNTGSSSSDNSNWSPNTDDDDSNNSGSGSSCSSSSSSCSSSSSSCSSSSSSCSSSSSSCSSSSCSSSSCSSSSCSSSS